MQLKLSRYHVISPIFRDGSGERKAILFSTRSGQARLLPRALIAWLERGQLERLDAVQCLELMAIELLVPTDQDELALVMAENGRAATEASNL